MKEKRDCKECGKPLKDWQVKQGYELCSECYSSGRRKAEGSGEVNAEKVNAEKENVVEVLDEHDERLEG